MTKLTEEYFINKLDEAAEVALSNLILEVKSKLLANKPSRNGKQVPKDPALSLQHKKAGRTAHGANKDRMNVPKTQKLSGIKAKHIRQHQESLEESIPIGMEDWFKKHKSQYFKKWGSIDGLKKLAAAAKRLAKSKAVSLKPAVPT